MIPVIDAHTRALTLSSSSLSASSSISAAAAAAAAAATSLSTSSSSSGSSQLVETASTASNLRSLALALCLNAPVLLEGPTGCGKTALIYQLASLAGRTLDHAPLSIQMGDQTDSKALLGSYVCTDQPGQFRYQTGPLAQAVIQGRWILIEDIDLAPMDVVSLLLPLLENGQLFVTGRGEVHQAAPGFQLFATRRTRSHHGSSGSSTASSAQSNASLLENLWTKVVIDPPTQDELHQIIKARFADVPADMVIRVFLDLQRASRADEAKLKEFSLRDLIKWCVRIANYAHDREVVFREAYDCFCALIANYERRKAIAARIAGHLQLDASFVDHHFMNYRPQFVTKPRELTVGRVTLGRTAAEQIQLVEQGAKFAMIKHSLKLMEQIGVCVRQREPVLLVGETGTGKTTIVQHLASELRKKLVVINMSQQSDSSDLMGGFKPVDVRMLAEPMLDAFEDLFRKTFSMKQKSNKEFLAKARQCFAQRQWGKLIKGFERSVASVIARFDGAAAADNEDDRHTTTAAAATDADASAAEGTKSRKVDRAATASVSVKSEASSALSSSSLSSSSLSSSSSSSSSAAAAASSSETVDKDLQRLMPELRAKWKEFEANLARLRVQVEQVRTGCAFAFIEGALVKAVRRGDWILLDEVNLASTETLECLNGLLDSFSSSLIITEQWETPIEIHEEFRLFACMNPATDVGKKDLPPGLRNRFTEFYVDEIWVSLYLLLLFVLFFVFCFVFFLGC